MPLILFANAEALRSGIMSILDTSNYSTNTIEATATASAVTGTGTLDAVPPTSASVPVTGTADAQAITISGNATTMIQVNSIRFRIPVFSGNGRIFSDTDTIMTRLNLSAGTLSAWSIENPFATNDAKMFEYTNKTVLSNNTQSVGNDAGIVYFVNNTDAFSQVQLNANTSVVYNLEDFYAQFADDFITQNAVYQQADLLGLDSSQYSDVKFTAGSENLFLYFQKEITV
jgi:hypothetical protein